MPPPSGSNARPGWRGRLNTADEQEAPAENSESDDARASAVSSDQGPNVRSHVTSPAPTRAVRMEGVAATPSTSSKAHDHAGTKPLLAILGEAAFLFFMGETLSDSDPLELTHRKYLVAVTLPLVMSGMLVTLVVSSIEVFPLPSILMLVAAMIAVAVHVFAFVYLHRTKDTPEWMVTLMAGMDWLSIALAQVAAPGLTSAYTVVHAFLFHPKLNAPTCHLVLVGDLLLLMLDGYNTVAKGSSWPVAGMADSSNILGMSSGIGGSFGVFLLLVANARGIASQRKADSKRDQDDAILGDAIDALQRFDTQALDDVVAKGQEHQVRESHQILVAAVIEAVARYRPHIPHYVLDAAVLASIANPPLEASTAMSPGADELRSMRSSMRHHRRLDFRSSGAFETGSSRSGRMANADTMSSRSRVSKYASAADDVGSVMSRRSDLAGGSVAGIQASPLYLARTRPIVHRRITVANLEYYVPNEIATTRAFALLVDQMLNKASEYEASVHTLVGDVAIISWNAVKSVSMAELLACNFCTDVMNFVRKDFAKRIVADARAPTGMRSMDFSLSAAPNMPRVTGAIVTGEARVCFAGTSSYEFCMSLPSLQPILFEYRRFASARNMLCIDAMTRNGAGRRVRVRGVDMITVSRRANMNALRSQGFGGSSGGGHAHSSTVDALGLGGDSHSPTMGLPLVELAKSPGLRQGLGDSTGPGTSEHHDENSFDLIIYELTQIIPDASKLSARSGKSGQSTGNRPGAAVSVTGTGGVSTAAPVNTFDAGDEDGLGLALALDGPSGVANSQNAFGRSPSNRYGAPPPIALMAQTNAKQVEDDPDELLTKGLSLAGMEKRYHDAARRFHQAIELIEKRMTEARVARANATSPQRSRTGGSGNDGGGGRNALSDAPGDGVTMHVPPTTGDMGAMFRRDTSDEYVDGQGSDNDASVERLTTLNDEQLLELASSLYNRALKAHDTSARFFGRGVVYVQSQ